MQLRPVCDNVIDRTSIFYEKTALFKDRLIKVAKVCYSSVLECIANNIYILNFGYDRQDFHIETNVKINFSNIFCIMRSYDGDCEGGGVFDIHLSDHKGEITPLFNHPDFENSVSDVNDSGLLRVFEQLQSSDNSGVALGLDGSVTYEQFRSFVVELFLSDFDY